jgi:TolB-like protein
MAATYILGPFRLDAETDTLFRGGEPVSLGHRAVALLRVLVERRGIPVSKDALMEAAWAGLTVEESNLAVQIAAVRRVFGEESGGENWIETLPRRGYRFVGPASIRDQGALTAASPAANLPGSSNPTLPDRPSIAVLPFQNISADPEQEYFADGMADEIITALSRFGSLFVIARNSSFTYKGRAVDVKQVARELGVRYVLEGSVRKAGNRVRFTGQLIDATTGGNIWADRFDGALEDVFELQDQVTARVRNGSRPRSSTLTTTSCAEWPVFICTIETASWKRCGSSCARRNSTAITPLPMEWRHGPARSGTAMAGWLIARVRSRTP